MVSNQNSKIVSKEKRMLVRCLLRKAMRLSIQHGIKIFFCARQGYKTTLYSSEMDHRGFLDKCFISKGSGILSNQDYQNVLIQDYRFYRKNGIDEREDAPGIQSNFINVDKEYSKIMRKFKRNLSKMKIFKKKRNSVRKGGMERKKKINVVDTSSDDNSDDSSSSEDYSIEKNKTLSKQSEIKKMVKSINKIIPDSEIPDDIMECIERKVQNEKSKDGKDGKDHKDNNENTNVNPTKSNAKENFKVNENADKKKVPAKISEVNTKRRKKSSPEKRDRNSGNNFPGKKEALFFKYNEVNSKKAKTTKEMAKLMKKQERIGNAKTSIDKKSNLKANDQIRNNTNMNNNSLNNTANSIIPTSKYQMFPNTNSLLPQSEFLNLKRNRTDTRDANNNAFSNPYMYPYSSTPGFSYPYYNMNMNYFNPSLIQNQLDENSKNMELESFQNFVNVMAKTDMNKGILDTNSILGFNSGNNYNSTTTPGNNLPMLNNFQGMSPLKIPESSGKK